jgi:hypothetical protein
MSIARSLGMEHNHILRDTGDPMTREEIQYLVRHSQTHRVSTISSLEQTATSLQIWLQRSRFEHVYLYQVSAELHDTQTLTEPGSWSLSRVSTLGAPPKLPRDKELSNQACSIRPPSTVRPGIRQP